MAIIYGNAISIGYATSGSTVGGTYSIWLTIPTVATTTTFTAVKDGVSVDSKYISSIGAAKITLPEDNPEGEWSITGTVGGKTVSKTVTIKSGTVDYFVDFRNDFIPLVGDLAVGNLVTFDNKEWRVVHQEGTLWYLATSDIVDTVSFGSNNVYKDSTLANRCVSWMNENLSATALEYCNDVTVENVTNKVFIPTYTQVNGGFSYYNSNTNRICNLNGSAKVWWISSPGTKTSGTVYGVRTDGSIYEYGNGYGYLSDSYGFRPHIVINITTDLDFTYTSDYAVRIDGVIEILNSGTFTVNNDMYVDIFCVGGGSPGAIPNNTTKYGGGGAGGFTSTLKNVKLTPGQYVITIGAGGIANTTSYGAGTAGGDTSFSDLIIAKGAKAAGYSTNSDSIYKIGRCGGSGGGAGYESSAQKIGHGGSDGSDGNDTSYIYKCYGGTGQGYTTREFGEPTGKLYAAGGGGGSPNLASRGLGGDGGGGDGGIYTTDGSGGTPATAGKPNTGSGGGGGAYGSSSGTKTYPANGGSGIICIRKTKYVNNWFDYTGNYKIRPDATVELYTDGILTINEDKNLDIFGVGGGGGSTDTYQTSSGYWFTGAGGGGGYTKTVLNKKITAGKYKITIGQGGDGFSVAGTGSSASSGTETIWPDVITVSGGGGGKRNASYENSVNGGSTGGSGGSGGGCSHHSVSQPSDGGSDGADALNVYGTSFGTSTQYATGGKGQGTTTAEFGELGSTIYAPGGGGIVSFYAGARGAGSTFGAGGTAGRPGFTGIMCIRKTKPQSTDIPLTGDLAVGNTVTFDDKSFVVVHNEGTKWYLAKETITDKTAFNSSSSSTYAGSTLASMCDTYLAKFSDTAKIYMTDVTVNNVTAKVFVPSYEQVNGGFSYYNSNTNRKAKSDNSSTIAGWWTSSGYNITNSVYRVVGGTSSDSGTIITATYDNVLGFRPHICIDTSLSGSATKETVLNGTYLFNTTLTTPPGTSYTETVQYKYHNGTGGTYNYITFNSNSGALGMNYHYSSMDSYTSVYNYSTQKWLDDIYRTIIFDNQTVTEEFYDWFIANATIKS